MQRVSVICVGKLKERFYTDAAAEYLKRLSRYCKAEVIELPEERLPEDPSPAQIEAALSREAGAVRGKLYPIARHRLDAAFAEDAARLAFFDTIRRFYVVKAADAFCNIVHSCFHQSGLP